MSDSVRPHRRQPTRLHHPWDSPGKITGVGCHFLLQCMKVKSEREVTQSCLILSDPMDCSLPGSSVHGIFPGNSTGVGCIVLYPHNPSHLQVFAPMNPEDVYIGYLFYNCTLPSVPVLSPHTLNFFFFFSIELHTF